MNDVDISPLKRLPPTSKSIGDIAIESAIYCLEGLEDSVHRCDFDEVMSSVKCAGEHIGRLKEWLYLNRNRILITPYRTYANIAKDLEDTLYDELVLVDRCLK